MPVDVVTVTSTVPAPVPGGDVAVIEVPLPSTVTPLAAVPPNITVVTPVNPVPVMVTVVPPVGEPLLGETPVTTGNEVVAEP